MSWVTTLYTEKQHSKCKFHLWRYIWHAWIICHIQCLICIFYLLCLNMSDICISVYLYMIINTNCTHKMSNPKWLSGRTAVFNTGSHSGSCLLWLSILWDPGNSGWSHSWEQWTCSPRQSSPGPAEVMSGVIHLQREVLGTSARNSVVPRSDNNATAVFKLWEKLSSKTESSRHSKLL